jgi:hypothetical protein
MIASAAHRYRLWLAVAFALTALKLWLTRGQGVYALGSAGHDDRLFIELARHLIQGEWLGPYNELTLAKGPFYPLFIAAVFSLGVPLFLAQHLFYAAACALFARALRPAVTSAGARLAIYALLLWNPMSFEGAAMGRVLRQHVYGPLALMIFAGLIALYFRRAEPARRQLPWVLLLGLAGAAFYLTREEVIWFAPSVLLLAGAHVISAWRISRETARRAAAWLGVSLVVACIPVLVVCAKNKQHYGWFGTCEFRANDFRDAYGAMLRVRVGPELPFVPVTAEARAAMATASPAFAELQKQFDAGLARGWAGSSEFFTHLPPEQGQIGGGWLMWAVREAAAQAGHHGNAAQALEFYRRVARELNDACDAGRLPAGGARSGFAPPWRDDQTGPFVNAAFDFTGFVVRFSRFSARAPQSSGSPEDLQVYRDITRERLSPPEGELDRVGAAQFMLNARKVDVLQQIGKALRPVLLGLFIASVILALIRAGLAPRRKSWTYPLTVAVAAGGACAASVLMHAMIEASSFPVLTVSSFAPIYPLLLVFIAAVLWDALAAWRAPHLASESAAFAAPAPALAPPAPVTPLHRALPWLAGLAALVPFLVWQREFRELFWFADDLFLLDQISQMGLRDWTTRVFAENYVPLFKLLWGGGVLAFDGSYAAMLWLLWLTHALNTFLLGRLLFRAGFPWLACLVTQLVFALTPANIETLGWSVQWSAVLAVTFLLLALWWHERHRDDPALFSWRLHGPLVLLVAASACSFSRGVLTGAVLALGSLLPALALPDWRAALRRAPGALLCLFPALAVAGMIMLHSGGNHQQLGGHWGEVLQFGASYFLLNPGHVLLGEISLHPAVLLVLAFGKIGIIAAGLYFSRGRVRHLLWLLLAYDLGSAVLVGVGRYHTGFLASLSSRYQYSALLATLPFAAFLLALAVDRFPLSRPRAWATAALVTVLVAGCLWGWPAALAGFTGWRGTEMRQLLAAPATNDPAVRVPAMEFMHVERAKALQRAYHLH